MRDCVLIPFSKTYFTSEFKSNNGDKMWTLVGEDGSHMAKSVYYSSCPADSNSWVYLSRSGEYKALTLNEESSVGKG